ncbi:MAG TPA: uracil-DNA glycosylase [Firmicutes bacterium]|nr:uracil-DNA glycosylase [Bacillota bacterium]
MIIHRKEELIRLEQSLQGCGKCPLGPTRTNLVFGRGSETGKIMLIGEGPGEQEDLQGVPFVGKAGQLLDKILAAAELLEEECYICNIVKCRPPQNRVPAPEEVEACLPYLRLQFGAIRPWIVVLLGASAAKAIIDPKLAITKARGKWVKKGDYLFMPTFHPAALLRDPGKKAPVWQDFQEIKRVYEEMKATKGETE